MVRRHLLKLLPAATLLPGCSDERPSRGPRMPKVKWRVFSSTHWTADLVRQAGGDAVESICILKPAVSPHQFAPHSSDLVRVGISDMLLLHGLGLENHWNLNVNELKEKRKLEVHTITDALPKEKLIFPSGPGGPPDPHVWTDPDLLILMLTAVAGHLSAALPKLEDYIQNRAAGLRETLRQGRDWIHGLIQQLPPERRCLLTSHDSLQYFARAFGLEARSIANAAGQAPRELPGNLLEWIKTHRLSTLFREQDTIIKGADGTALAAPTEQNDVIRRMLGGSPIKEHVPLYSLALAAPGTIEVIGGSHHNVGTCAGALTYAGDIIQSRLLVE